jgi:23S rRNA (uracil1939-C5)-methyltransferase
MRQQKHRATVAQGQPKIGTTLEVEIERILPGGMGLAHAEDMTVLVALAAPGDRALVRLKERRGRVWFASIVEIRKASPVRIEPPCPYFGRCGGCDFQQLTYPAQLEAKIEIVRDCLRRIARIEPPGEILIIESPAEWRYRSRAEWQRDRERFGYFERGSHRICDVVECPVITEPLQDALTTLRGERDSLPDNVREFQAVAGDEGEVALAPNASGGKNSREVVRVVNGESYLFDAECFFQINHTLLSSLVDEAVKDAKGQSAIDLYCGVGLFTLPLARKFEHVTGVESNRAATRYARLNLSNAGRTNWQIETAQVGEWITKNKDELKPVDLLLLDPPRAGAEAETVRAILELRPGRIVYVSCDPATLARDLKSLVADGAYTLDSLIALDMFPQTHHVETIAKLSKHM